MIYQTEKEVHVPYETYLRIDKCIREESGEYYDSSDLGWMRERFIKDLLGIVFPSQKIILERPSSSLARHKLRLLVMNQDMV